MDFIHFMAWVAAKIYGSAPLFMRTSLRYFTTVAGAGAATRPPPPPTYNYYYCHPVALACTRLRQTIQDVRGREKDPGCATAHLRRGLSDPGWLSSQSFALLPILKRRPDPRYGV